MKNPVVNVVQGKLEGIFATTQTGKEYQIFSGIPFAEPPIENLRFKDPVIKKPWEGIWDATKERGIAAQFEAQNDEYSGIEDCLYLNVYAPKCGENACLSVMFFIHPGAFLTGHGGRSSFDPEYFIEGDIVFVSANYRLGVMGFLCTDSKNARGDMGIKDQQLALKWVQENITYFNGNPKDVTLLGISAGGSSVEYHMASKQSAGLFHKAIIASGTILGVWATASRPIEIATKLAKLLGYDENSEVSLFEFINKFSAEILVRTSTTISTDEDFKNGTIYPFVPVVNQFKDGRDLIDDDLMEIFKNGKYNKVPTIVTICNKEGFFCDVLYYTEPLKDLIRNQAITQLLPDRFKAMENFQHRINEAYKPKQDSNVTYDFLTDLIWTGGMFNSLKPQLNDGLNHYLACFEYDGNLNLVKKYTTNKEMGACHGDDSNYIQGPYSVDVQGSAVDYTVRDRMLSFYMNFAKTGNPTPEKSELINEKWLPADNDFRYLNIRENIQMITSMWPERRQLWLDFYEHY